MTVKLRLNKIAFMKTPLSVEERKQQLDNGPIYIFVDWVIRSVYLISPVEWKKRGALKLFPRSNSDEIRRIANIAIDVFIVLKWIFVLSIWYFGFTNFFVVTIAIFLLVMNLHTYFWYHLWTIEKNGPVAGVEFRERRRFVNLVFAISYSMVLYAYLYHRILQVDFTWSTKISPWIAALVFSVGNALTGFSGDLKPETEMAQLVVSSQLVMTFIFVAMLLSNSVPRPKN